MARNNPKPSEKINWQAIGEIIVPSAARKLAGWLFNIKPPAQNFNWKWVLDTLNITYIFAQVEDWIVIDSDADEGDYATLTAYLADAPAAGNRVLIKEDQTVTVQTVIPDDITLKFLDGSRLLCATNIATSVLQFGSDIVVEGVLNIVLSQTGVTAKAVELNGDNVTGKINIENSSTGTLTTGYHINASKTGNRIDGFIDNTGGGVLTNKYVDNSTEDSNYFNIVDGVSNVITTKTGKLSAGKGVQTDGVNFLKTKVIDIGDWDMDATAGISVAHGISSALLNIRTVDVVIRDDGALARVDVLNRIPISDGSDTTPQGGVASISSTHITIARLTGGDFDDTNYDQTSFNRGWVTITYT